MTTIKTLPNSVWPNGLKRDEEGYVIFYPLGTNKVDISTITWPEGTEVKSPFVYQDDKLVGFIDTKALEIDNNDTTIDINYTHFDADLDSIIENTLTINAPANAAVNVKYGAVDKVLTEKIEKLIGKDKCEIKFDKNNNKVTITFALDTAEAQIADVESLLNRVLPSNLATEMEWPGGLPITYTKLEYLEGAGTQWIDTGITLSNESEVKCKGSYEKQIDVSFVYGARQSYFVKAFTFLASDGGNNSRFQFDEQRFNFEKINGNFEVKQSKNQAFLNGNLLASFQNITFEPPVSAFLFHVNEQYPAGYTPCSCKIYSFSISRNGQLQCNYIPALNDTGTPGMYDTVNKVFKTNAGTGDFLYPTDAAPAMSAGLDEKFYAKLTEHGVCRLYHVPNGCTMTKDEYAAANGFKELVEPPMPLEDYWRPIWRETETQLICDWVETEPLTEEI